MQIKVEWREEEGEDDCLDDVLGPNLELFPGLALPCDELCAELDDLDMIWPEARELRNHDCMWAGLCVSEKHERDSVRPERVIMPPARRRVVAPTNARSVLLPPPPRLPDRPDTPLSENELDLDLPELCDLLEDLPSVVPSEVTGQVASVVKVTPPPQPTPQPCTVTAYVTPNMDHCYFTTALPPDHPVHPDSLGVQTPSDSEEEIDVETVAESRKPCRTAYSTANMPTTPTLQDRREIQRTVSAIVRRGRPSLSYDRRKRKRRLSSGDFTGECGRKAVKRKQYRRMQNKAKRRRRQLARHSSSDSEELESTERRSLHNNLERQRRIDLRNAFEELRVLLPDTADNEKAAKVAILNSGAQYCLDLEHREKKLLMQKAELRKHQDRLREEVSRLRRSLAMRR